MERDAKHDQTRDGGRRKEQVDPKKFSKPKDDGGKHSDDKKKK